MVQSRRDVRILLLGEPGVGKTSLILSLVSSLVSFFYSSYAVGLGSVFRVACFDNRLLEWLLANQNRWCHLGAVFCLRKTLITRKTRLQINANLDLQ